MEVVDSESWNLWEGTQIGAGQGVVVAAGMTKGKGREESKERLSATFHNQN